MNARAWTRRIGLGLVAMAWLLAAHPQAQTAPVIQWAHPGTNVTHFQIVIGTTGTWVVDAGLPTPSGTTYEYALPALPAGQWQVKVRACYGADCQDSAAMTVVKMVPAGATALNYYWVSPTGEAANWAACKSDAPLEGAAACSLATFKAATEAAGDTIWFRGGAYTDSTSTSIIEPANDGTADAKIVFAAHPNETPIFTNTYDPGHIAIKYPIRIHGNDYIAVRGLQFVNFQRYITINAGSDYNEIAYCEISRTVATDVSPIASARGIHVYAGYPNEPVSTHNWIHHNTVHDIYGTACNEQGDCIQVSDSSDGNRESNYNTIENNLIYHCGHAATDNFSRFNVWRSNRAYNDGFKTHPGNLTGTATGGSSTSLVDNTRDFSALGAGANPYTYVHNQSDPGGGSAYYALITSASGGTVNYASGTTFTAGQTYRIGCMYDYDTNPPGNGKYAHRAFMFDGMHDPTNYPDRLLIEGNRGGHAASNPANDGAESMALSSTHDIVRFNALYGSAGSGLYLKNDTSSSSAHIYQNAIVQNGRFSSTQLAGNPIPTVGIEQYGATPSVALVNNIIYGNPSDIQGTPPGTWTVANNHLTTDGDPLFTNNDLTQPSSATLPNLTLSASSAAKDTGGALTTATANQTNSTSLVVADSGFFQDGSLGSDLTRTAGVMHGDWVAVGTVSNVAQISSINYATHTITLASPLSWSAGASVWLYKDSWGRVVLVGTAPDKGAYEYGIGTPTATTNVRIR